MFQRFLTKYDFLKPIDILVLGYYLFLSVLVLIFNKNLPYWWMYIFLHIFIMYIVFLFVRDTDRSQNEVLKFLRYFYPILLYTVMYEEVNSLVHIIFPEWLDRHVYDVEYALFGFHATAILDKIKSLWVTEFFKISYFSYYWIVFIPMSYLLITKKTNAAVDYIETMSIAYYICYIGFIFFPVRGPRYELTHLHPEPLAGFIISPIQDFIMKTGSMYGGCMPSSHVAAAWVSAAMIYRYMRKAFIPVLILVIFLSISTVYCRYHYFLDVIAGFIVFLIALYIRPLYNEFIIRLKYNIKKG
ncbi:phosphatase PAP2 family protein [bacterium]